MALSLFLYHILTNSLTHKVCSFDIDIHNFVEFLLRYVSEIGVSINTGGINKNINSIFREFSRSIPYFVRH